MRIGGRWGLLRGDVMKTDGNELSSIAMCPAQQKAVEALELSVGKGTCCVLWSSDGLGRTSVLRELQRRIGGVRLTMREFAENAGIRHPLALEDTLYRIVWDAMAGNEIVIVDDMHLLQDVWAGCHAYPRSNYFAVGL